jgi:hypothetical protein
VSLINAVAHAIAIFETLLHGRRSAHDAAVIIGDLSVDGCRRR